MAAVIDNGNGIPSTRTPSIPTSPRPDRAHDAPAAASSAARATDLRRPAASACPSSTFSRLLDLEIERDGGRFIQLFVDGGEPTGPLERIGDSDGHGTTVTFWPDPSIMEELEFRAQTLLERLREMAFLNKNLEIVFRDERVDPVNEQVFKYAGGIIDFVTHLNASKEPLFARVIDINDSYDGGEVDIAMQWNTGFTRVCTRSRTTSPPPKAACTKRASRRRSPMS